MYPGFTFCERQKKLLLEIGKLIFEIRKQVLCKHLCAVLCIRGRHPTLHNPWPAPHHKMQRFDIIQEYLALLWSPLASSLGDGQSWQVGCTGWASHTVRLVPSDRLSQGFKIPPGSLGTIPESCRPVQVQEQVARKTSVYTKMSKICNSWSI